MWWVRCNSAFANVERFASHRRCATCNASLSEGQRSPCCDGRELVDWANSLLPKKKAKKPGVVISIQAAAADFTEPDRFLTAKALPNPSLTVAALVEHYKERELGDDSGKAAKPRKAYLYIFNDYILPKWGSLPIAAVKTVAVEDWLKTLSLANGSKAKVREVFGAAFRHAMRHGCLRRIPLHTFGKSGNELSSLTSSSLPRFWQYSENLRVSSR
jgi:hypothetical protein